VFVYDKNKLEHAKDFTTSTNTVLEHSRIFVAWQGCGIAAGAYEACLRYTLKR
jgi:alkylation response protein AidB-like acyl-CoA dehydrogenase